MRWNSSVEGSETREVVRASVHPEIAEGGNDRGFLLLFLFFIRVQSW